MPNEPAEFEKWKADALAMKGEAFDLHLPDHVLAGEAVDGAKFVLKYWEAKRDPVTKQVVFPGLEMAGANKVTLNTATELLSLRAAFQHQQTVYLLTVAPASGESPMPRAKHVLREITSALEFRFDDGVEDERDQQLASLAEAHRDDPETMDAVAAQLEDYSTLAGLHRADLVTMESFRAELIDEAKKLAAELRRRPPEGPERSAEQLAAMDLRDRLGTLLLRKIRVVRSAARYVFRDYPEVIREATSAYERRKRAEARRAQMKKEAQGDG